MRRFQKWLTVGLLALTTPGMAFAGPGTTKKAPTARAQSAAGKSSKQSANQELANRVRQTLESSDVSMYEVEIMVHNGTALLKGQVASPADKREAEMVVRKVPGVQHVQNQLDVAQKGGRPVQQASNQQRRGAGRMVQPTAYQDAYEGAEPIQTPSVPPAPGGVSPVPGSVYGEGAAPQYAPGPSYGPGPGPSYGAGPAYAGQGMPGGPAPMPAYGGPAYGSSAGSSSAIYNQPNLPNYSYPAYSQFPNYASVSYPSQYSASAWPYIGPFYPYPQVPLGWRKAQLEWDDGYWHLNFSPRTERWWWFLDWRNW